MRTDEGREAGTAESERCIYTYYGPAPYWFIKWYVLKY